MGQQSHLDRASNYIFIEICTDRGSFAINSSLDFPGMVKGIKGDRDGINAIRNLTNFSS